MAVERWRGGLLSEGVLDGRVAGGPGGPWTRPLGGAPLEVVFRWGN